jgi:hypothetical protein
MEEIGFKCGDLFIHFTKYGGVNKGVINSLGHTTCYDTTNGCSYVKFHLITTKGVLLQLDGSDGQIFKITEELSVERCQELEKLFSKMGHRKGQIHVRIEEKIKNGDLKFPDAN